MPDGWPAERPEGGSEESEGVDSGRISGGLDGDGLGSGSRDGSEAGAPALGEGVVALGSLAVPTRVMRGEGPLVAVLVCGELAMELDPVATPWPPSPEGAPVPAAPGTVSGRIPARLWSTPPTPVESPATVVTVRTITQTATTRGRLPQKGPSVRLVLG
jgi:hypothetical protein